MWGFTTISLIAMVSVPALVGPAGICTAKMTPETLSELLEARSHKIKSYRLVSETFYVSDPRRNPAGEIGHILADADAGKDAVMLTQRYLSALGKEVIGPRVFTTIERGDEVRCDVDFEGGFHETFVRQRNVYAHIEHQPDSMQVSLHMEPFARGLLVTLDSLNVRPDLWLKNEVIANRLAPDEGEPATISFRTTPVRDLTLFFTKDWDVRRLECRLRGAPFLQEWNVGQTIVAGVTIPKVRFISRIGNAGKITRLDVTFVRHISINEPVQDVELNPSYPGTVTVIDYRQRPNNGFRLKAVGGEAWHLNEIIAIADQRKPPPLTGVPAPPTAAASTTSSSGTGLVTALVLLAAAVVGGGGWAAKKLRRG